MGICKNGANVKCAYSEIGGNGNQYHQKEEEKQEGNNYDSDRYMGM